jgi:hypothetical protein
MLNSEDIYRDPLDGPNQFFLHSPSPGLIAVHEDSMFEHLFNNQLNLSRHMDSTLDLSCEEVLSDTDFNIDFNIPNQRTRVIDSHHPMKQIRKTVNVPQTPCTCSKKGRKSVKREVLSRPYDPLYRRFVLSEFDKKKSTRRTLKDIPTDPMFESRVLVAKTRSRNNGRFQKEKTNG